MAQETLKIGVIAGEVSGDLLGGDLIAALRLAYPGNIELVGVGGEALERQGLKERAASIIAGMRGATTGRLLIAYLAFRQITAALGLISIAGQAQTVRPIVAPMAEAASHHEDDSTREEVRAMAAATDNIGVFFGEDIFLAISSILLIRAFLAEYGIDLEPIQLSVWAIPTAICAFLIHGARLLLLDRRLKK